MKQLVLWSLEKVHLKMILRRKRKKMRMTNSWIQMKRLNLSLHNHFSIYDLIKF